LKNKHTYLSSFFFGRYGHIRIRGEVEPDIGVFLYGRNLSRPPVEKFIIEGLNIPPSPLVPTTTLPIYIMLGERSHALILSLMD
jgi:hypothetical protein